MGPHIFPSVFPASSCLWLQPLSSHAHPRHFSRPIVEVESTSYSTHIFLVATTSWITACRFPYQPHTCRAMLWTKLHFLSTLFSCQVIPPTRSVPWCAPRHRPMDREVSMGWTPSAAAAISPRISAGIDFKPLLVISGRKMPQTEGLLEIPSSSQANPTLQDKLKGLEETPKATRTSLPWGRSCWDQGHSQCLRSFRRWEILSEINANHEL